MFFVVVCVLFFFFVLEFLASACFFGFRLFMGPEYGPLPTLQGSEVGALNLYRVCKGPPFKGLN